MGSRFSVRFSPKSFWTTLGFADLLHWLMRKLITIWKLWIVARRDNMAGAISRAFSFEETRFFRPEKMIDDGAFRKAGSGLKIGDLLAAEFAAIAHVIGDEEQNELCERLKAISRRPLILIDARTIPPDRCALDACRQE